MKIEATLPEAKSYDVLVVGMGPAGATAAYELSRAGMAVLGLDKQAHPRYKACGGGLSVRIEQILESDFKTVIEHTIYGVQFTYRGERPFLLESSRPIAYMVMRDRFDHLLVEKARRAGTEVHEDERAIEFHERPDWVEVVTDKGRYRTKVLIGADGANSVVAQRLFPERRLRRMPTLESEIGIGQTPVYPGEGKVLIDLGATERGYAWIFPKKERLSIGVAEFRGRPASPKGIFERFVRDEKGLATLTVPQPFGHPLPLYGSRNGAGGIAAPTALVRHRALLVGDAGHLVDPLFGEGIYYAVRSGQMAAASVLGSFHDRQRSLLDYDLAVNREIYPEFRIASRMARIVYTVPRLCHSLMHRSQEVIRLYYDVLQGRETYQTFFLKAKGLIKASFRELLREALPFS
ncbi:MAG: geranylgeranyl reductase family protein [Nitrospirae bacterium]|nr:MAG: geranylgeranyl reductase family protein [Nitrospirota bacterium]